MDLATEWRSRRWRRLLNIIEGLPRASAYFEAISEDEDLAERMLARPAPKQPAPRRRMADWSPAVEMLTAILDRLGELTQTVAAVAGAKPRKVPRAAYPVTAIDRMRHRKRVEGHRSLVARVLPGKQQPNSDSHI